MTTLIDKDGHLVGLPNEMDPSGIFYRRDLAKQYLGTDDPEAVGKLIGAGTPNWDAFVAVGEKLKKDSGGKAFLIAGLQDLYNVMSRQPKGIWHDGNKLLVKENILPEFKLLEKVRAEGLDAKIAQFSPTWNSSFAKGNVLFFPGAPWFTGYVIKPNDPDGNGRWAVTGTPVANWSWGGGGIGVPQQSPNKAAAFEWVKYRTMDKEGVKIAFQSSGAIPASPKLMDDPVFQQPNPILGGQIGVPFFLAHLDGIVLPPEDANEPMAKDVISQGLSMLDNGSATAEQAADFVDKTLREKLTGFN